MMAVSSTHTPVFLVMLLQKPVKATERPNKRQTPSFDLDPRSSTRGSSNFYSIPIFFLLRRRKNEGICNAIAGFIPRIRGSSAQASVRILARAKIIIHRKHAVDIFQLSLLCDALRLGLICHRFILKNFKSVSATEGWNAMKESHPVLEKEVLTSIIDEDFRQKERTRKASERKIYEQLYEAMEALVHICRDGCRTIGPFNKTLRDDCEPCEYMACKGLEALVRHFAGCKLRGPGGCVHCKRMWQILELHSRLCVDSDACGVPLCGNFRQRRGKQNKKEDMKWRILVKKIVRSKSANGAPFFVLESTIT